MTPTPLTTSRAARQLAAVMAAGNGSALPVPELSRGIQCITLTPRHQSL